MGERHFTPLGIILTLFFLWVAWGIAEYVNFEYHVINALDKCKTGKPIHISVSSSTYPHVEHVISTARAYPNNYSRLLVLDQHDASVRRSALLATNTPNRKREHPQRSGQTRVEYPPSYGRVETTAYVSYAPSTEYKNWDKIMQRRLKYRCDGQKFMIVVTP
jgi:hypothetical protein